MIFKSFTYELDLYGSTVDNKVNDFISHHESKGLEVVDHSVVGGRQGDNSLIKPVVTIIVWMEKRANND